MSNTMKKKGKKSTVRMKVNRLGMSVSFSGPIASAIFDALVESTQTDEPKLASEAPLAVLATELTA